MNPPLARPMDKLKIKDTKRMAFPGFIFSGYHHRSAKFSYNIFKIVWTPNMKEEFNQKDTPISFTISMN